MNTQQHNVIHVFSRKYDFEKNAMLRTKKPILGSIFGQKKDTDLVAFPNRDLMAIIKSGADAALIYLQDEKGGETPVLIDEIQSHPVTGDVHHVTFKRVDLLQKITAEVEVVLEGEVAIPGATVVLVRDAVEVEALPADLPDNIAINIEGLTEIGQTLHIANAQFDRERVKILMTDEELEEPMVIVQEVKEEVEPEPSEETVEGEAAEDEAAEADESTDAPADQKAE